MEFVIRKLVVTSKLTKVGSRGKAPVGLKGLRDQFRVAGDLLPIIILQLECGPMPNMMVASVRENVGNNSRKRKKSMFFLKKR